MHHRDLADYIANDELDWQHVARAFREQAFFTGLGDLPSPAFLQDTWRQVDEAQAA